jgi:hypothetical protein
MQRLSLLPLLVRLAATTVGVLYPTTQASAQTLVVDCANIKGCDSKSPCLDAAKKTLSVTPTMTAERAALLTAFTNIPSWTAATDAPCGAGWNDYRQGWRGIKCDKPGGRVTHM